MKDWIAISKHSAHITGYGKLNEEQLRILDDVPGSAVELQNKDKVNSLRFLGMFGGHFLF